MLDSHLKVGRVGYGGALDPYKLVGHDKCQNLILMVVSISLSQLKAITQLVIAEDPLRQYSVCLDFLSEVCSESVGLWD